MFKRSKDTIAVIVAAGSGSRMKAVTKGGAKELVPLQDNIPSIGYSILESLKKGINKIVIVSNKNKTDLEAWLNGSEIGPNGSDIVSLQKIIEMAGNPEGIEIEIVHQEIPLGLGHAVLAAKASKLLKNFKGFIYVLLPDEVFVTKQTPEADHIGELSFAEEILNSEHSMVLTMPVQREDQGRFGIVVTDENGFVTRFVEKPKPADKIDSLDAIAGRYLFSTEIFDHLQLAYEKMIIGIKQAAKLHRNVSIDFSDLKVNVQVGSADVRMDAGSMTFNEAMAKVLITLAEAGEVSKEDAYICGQVLKQVLAIEIDGKEIGELQLTDAIQHMLEAGEKVGIASLPDDDILRLDAGTAEGYEIAVREIHDLLGIEAPPVPTVND